MENTQDRPINRKKKKKLFVKILVIIAGIALLFTSFLPFLPYLFR
jgi:hypothetical protein